MLIGQKKPVVTSCLDQLPIERDELTMDLQFVADNCGIETVAALLKFVPGTSIYIPKVSHLREFVERYIKENRGKSTKQIAAETKVSESHLRLIKSEMRKRARKK